MAAPAESAVAIPLAPVPASDAGLTTKQKVLIGLGAGAGAVVLAVAVPIAIPVAVGALGFGSGGIVAGSTAASIMASYGGAVTAGSACAILQSIGAAGLGTVGIAAAASGGAVVGAGAGGAAAAMVAARANSPSAAPLAVPSLYDFTVSNKDGNDVPLSVFAEKVVLIVNVPIGLCAESQLRALTELRQRYRNEGLQILLFPSEQPIDIDTRRDNLQIDPCIYLPSDVYGSLSINGDSAHPLYKWLKTQQPGALGIEKIWRTYTKFLVDRNGAVVGRFTPSDLVSALEEEIKKQLTK